MDVHQGQITSMQDRFCQCDRNEVKEAQEIAASVVEDPGDGPSEPIDLTMDTDRDEVDEEQDEIVLGRTGGSPMVDKAESTLVPIHPNASVSQQRCVRSSGPFKKPAPYWIATGVRRDWVGLPKRDRSSRVAKRKTGRSKVGSYSSELESGDDLEWGWHSDAPGKRRSDALVGGSGRAQRTVGGLELLVGELHE